MATEALEHDFFKDCSLSRGRGSPGGSSRCYGDSFHSNPLQQVESSPKPHTSSIPSPVKEKDTEGQTEEDDKEQLLLEASQDSGVGAQDTEDIENSQERDKSSSFTDSLLTDTAELDLFECRELEEWGWESPKHDVSTGNNYPPFRQEDADSSVKPPAKRMKHKDT